MSSGIGDMVNDCVFMCVLLYFFLIITLYDMSFIKNIKKGRTEIVSQVRQISDKLETIHVRPS